MKHKDKDFFILTILPMLVIVSLLLLPACVRTVEHRGFVISALDLDSVKPGKSKKEEVQKILGSPSAKSTFAPEEWYYIGTEVQKSAFEHPKATHQEITVVRFNEDNTVKEIEQLSSENAKNIAFSEDYTPTEGTSFTIFEQLINNLGRFNPKQ